MCTNLLYWETSKRGQESLILVNKIHKIKLIKGQKLFTEGTPVDSIYVIKEGELEISK